MGELDLQKRLIELRKEKGLTQKELAEQINYSDKVISKWERGESLPSILVIKELSKLYNVSSDYILENNVEVEKQVTLPRTLDVVRTGRPTFIEKYFILIPLALLILSITQGPGVFALILALFLIPLIIWAALMSKSEWTSEFEGHTIQIVNSTSKCELMIDNQVVDGIYGLFSFSPALNATIGDREISVKIANSVRLSCIIFIK